MKGLWFIGHLRCSLPSPAVAFQQLTASFKHQSLPLLVLCMKYDNFDSITLLVPVYALAPFGFFNCVGFQELSSRDGASEAVVRWQDPEAPGQAPWPLPAEVANARWGLTPWACTLDWAP